MQRGTLFLVAGPSGAGKDTLLDAARRHFRHDPRYVFPRRLITRAADAGGEDHITLSPAAFAARKADGKLLLDWTAHGLSYGIDGSAADALAGGRHVVVNVSRSVLPEARKRYPPVRILSVEVPPAVLRRRLRQRGRESAADLEERLRRASSFTVAGDDVTVIRNGGDLETAAAQFVAALNA